MALENKLGITDSVELARDLGGFTMAVSYKKLWKLLIDKDIKKKDLRKAAMRII